MVEPQHDEAQHHPAVPPSVDRPLVVLLRGAAARVR